MTSGAGAWRPHRTDATATDDDVVLRAVDISKTYGVTRALKGVNFDIHRGQGHHAVRRERRRQVDADEDPVRAWSSRPPARSILDGEPVDLRSTTDARDRGISIIHQELNLAPNLSVRDNIFMGRELRTRPAASTSPRERQITAQLMERLEEEIDPRTPGRGPAPRPAADRRDRPGAVGRRPHPDHGRADLGAQRHRGRGAVQGDPRPDRPRRLDRLHLAPPRGGAADHRLRGRLPRRRAGGHRGRGRASTWTGSSGRWSAGRPTTTSATSRATTATSRCRSRTSTVAEPDTGRVVVNDVSLDVRRGRDRLPLRADGRRPHRADGSARRPATRSPAAGCCSTAATWPA